MYEKTVSGKLPPMKIPPQSGSGFGLRLALELGLGPIFLEPEKTHKYLKDDCQFFDTLKTKDRKIR